MPPDAATAAEFQGFFEQVFRLHPNAKQGAQQALTLPALQSIRSAAMLLKNQHGLLDYWQGHDKGIDAVIRLIDAEIKKAGGTVIVPMVFRYIEIRQGEHDACEVLHREEAGEGSMYSWNKRISELFKSIAIEQVWGEVCDYTTAQPLIDYFGN